MTAITGWLYSVTGSYGAVIAISVLVCSILLVPFGILSRRNGEAKKRIVPVLKEIRSRYGAGPVSLDPSAEGLAPEIQTMTVDEREAGMAEEIRQAYRVSRYYPAAGIIPVIAVCGLAVLMYAGLSGACPEGIYSATMDGTLAALKNGAAKEAVISLVLLWLPAVPATVRAVKSIVREAERQVNEGENGTAMTVTVLSALAGTALVVWIIYRTTAAIALAMFLFGVLRSAEALIMRKVMTDRNGGNG